MGNTLVASEIRIEWASEKLDQLKAFTQRAIDHAVKGLVGEPNEDRMRVMLDLNATVTPEARRLVSEYALHARAALDYIVYDIAFHNHGEFKKGTQFPIHSLPEKFPWKMDETSGVRGVGCLQHLHPEQVALIERFQPYNGFPLLHVLHGLSNRDKHRHFARISTTGLSGQFPTTSTDPSTGATKVQMKFKSTFHVTLEGRDDAVETLSVLQTQLTQILATFNELLDSET